jgi:hypothetical protein
MRKVTLGPNKNRGLFSYMYTTFAYLYTAVLKGEEFFIDWTGDNNYLVPELGTNVYEYWFEQPYIPQDISKEITEFSLKLEIDVCEEERELLNNLLVKYMIPKESIKKEIEKFTQDNFSGNKVLAVHKRGTDHYLHSDILPNKDYFDVIDKLIIEEGYNKVFLATDEKITITEFQNKYGDKLIHCNHIRVDGNIALFDSPVDKFTHGKEVIIECYLMSKADCLVKTKSTVSNFACYLNKDLKYIAIDKHIPWK